MEFECLTLGMRTKLGILFIRTTNPAIFLPAGFQLAATVLLAIVPVRLYQSSIRAYSDRNQFIGSHIISTTPSPCNFLLGELATKLRSWLGRNRVGATRGFPLLCLYNKANSLTLNRPRDNPNQPTFTSVFKSDPKMNAGLFVHICSGQFTNMAWLASRTAKIVVSAHLDVACEAAASSFVSWFF